MSLRFDEQLSPRLADRLCTAFPGSTHVHLHGLGGGGDREVFEFARVHGLAIVTKDSNFVDLVAMELDAGKRATACRDEQHAELARHRLCAVDDRGRSQNGTIPFRAGIRLRPADALQRLGSHSLIDGGVNYSDTGGFSINDDSVAKFHPQDRE